MNNKGLTIIELLVTLVISSLIMGAAIAFHLANQRLFVKDEALVEIRSSVRGALDIIVSDLRLAGYNPTQAVAPTFDPAINGATSTWISMVMDEDSNGICDANDWKEYWIAGNDLIRHITVLATDQLVAENIDYLEFRYFDTDGNLLVTPVVAGDLENIKSIKIIIIGKTLKSDGTPRGFSNHKESGNYPDGTPYDDKCYRCWDSTFVNLRNI